MYNSYYIKIRCSVKILHVYTAVLFRVVTVTPSFQMAKFQPPVVKIMSLKKGERSIVFTNQACALKQWRDFAAERKARQEETNGQFI